MKHEPLVLAILIPVPLIAPAAGVDAFDVIWNAPSANHHGSMPLGNGDIALNAWMTGDGDLHFYISKTDAWDDNARLLKVGKVRVHFEPNPIATGKFFRQELKLNEGCIEITTGEPGTSAQSAIRNPQSGSGWTPTSPSSTSLPKASRRSRRPLSSNSGGRIRRTWPSCRPAMCS
jgi:hypothetical protein